MINSILDTFQADFKQRVRQQSYMVTLLSMTVLTMLFFPSLDASYQTVVINGYRGLYNSAWMGASLALLNISFLPLICFYIIKGTLEYDRTQQVGELIAATQVKKSQYVLGKWLSNLCLLLGMLTCMCITSIFVQLWHGESYAINLLDLILPQLVYVAPMLLVVAAVAILFESVPILRGGVGNVVYFFLWSLTLVNMMFGVSGVSELHAQLLQGFAQVSSEVPDNVQIGITVSNSTPNTFYWQGLAYSIASWLPVGKMFLVALLLLILAITFFDRFKRVSQEKSSVAVGLFARGLAKWCYPIDAIFLSVTRHFAFTRLVRQELLLMLRGWPLWWYISILALMLAQLVVSTDILRGVMLPLSWLLCVLALSPLGQRETQHNTQQLMFNSPSLLKQQLPAMLVAGTLLLLMVSGGALIRFCLSADVFSILMLLSGSLFIVLLALTCGVLTKTSRTFEILFTVLWYMGPLNQATYLDFIGVDLDMSKQVNAPLIFLSVSALLLLAAFTARRRQLSI